MKIMFVCTGNTCRSAMAEGLAKKEIVEKNLNIDVCSAGISAATGENASYNTIAVLKEYNVDMLFHKSTNILESKINDMDLILCMTNKHKQILISAYPNLKEKIYTLKEFCGFNTDSTDTDISDPWGYDINTYRLCCAEISFCIDKLIEKLIKEGRI